MGRMQIRLRFPWILGLGVLLTGVSFSWAQGQSSVVVVKAARQAVSPPLSQIAPLPAASRGLRLVPDDRMVLHTPGAARTFQDGALQASPEAFPLATLSPLSTTPGLNILGVGTGFGSYVDQASVPDTNGAVGTTQFVQFVNESFAVFNKSDGRVALGPVNGSTLWQALTGVPCSASPHLDVIAQFDKLANRWVMMMAAGAAAATPYLCVAVSKTSDAVNGGWNLYAFQAALNSSGFRYGPDYPKLAVWSDAYYVTYNQDNNGMFAGAAACALDRNGMLAGNPAATMQCFLEDPVYGGLLPADLDGTTPPPTGAPEYFLNFDANHQSLDLWQFHVDWTNPANSWFGSGPTITSPTNITVPVFIEPCSEAALMITYTTGDCIPQAGTTQMLDSYGDRLMYRLAYRNFGTYQALVANHTVQVTQGNNQTGIRWYELQNTGSGFGLYQQGTYSPDSDYRWMGSIAMDGAGDIALGYSVSGSVNPSIRYTGRVPSDPLGQMEGEIDVLSAASISPASQTSSFHWADYSSMSIDPTDDCTFWYTTEYVPAAGSNWSTRIASFSFPSCRSTLTVNISGAGAGIVTSTPAGINCSTSQCSSTFVSGTSVTLAAAAATGSGFGGWNGACSGTGACPVTMTSNQTVGASFNLLTPPDFTVTPSPLTKTVSAGGTAAFNLSIAGVGGFSTAVMLSCTPPAAQGMNCSLASTSAMPGTSVSLTVTTTGPSAALTLPPGTMPLHPLYAAWTGFPALALAGIGSVGLRSKKRRLACLLLCATLLGSVVLQMSCGSSSSTTPKNGGTPAGTYPVNINATSGNTQHSSSVSVTVQ
jgi:Divergent InlB B-repeat domain